MATLVNIHFRSWESDAGFQHDFPSRRISPAERATASSDGSIVFIVDDDRAVREALTSVLSSLRYSVLTFESAQEFLDFERPDCPGCVIVDLELPGRSSLEIQRQVAGASAHPIVFTTDGGNVSSYVRAMRGGAIDILQKPLDEESLLEAIQAALASYGAACDERLKLAKLQQHYALLTPREREVLPLVTAGLLNKQTAAELGTSEITIGVHRGQIMRKMAAQSLAELVRMADKLGVQCSRIANHA